MLFYTPEFALFFAGLLIVLALVGGAETRKLVLTVASYVFYMAWNPAFVVLIAFSTAVDFAVGRKLGEEIGSRRRRAWLLASLVANLGLLGFFKYAGFFSASALWLVRALGGDVHWTTLELILPVGISFYTFQSMSYTIDVYRGRIAPTRSPLDFALFVAFFPTLVAGPIVRASDFLPQLEAGAKLGCDQETLFLVLRGLVKKVLVADNLARFADSIFEDPEHFPSVVIALAAAAFAVQIYCDFSGYSDMAIGLARILGFRLPQNFDHPYVARNPQEFWRRWHISLSSWLRDYLYIPLGGNRRGPARTAINLMLTMLLGGLWHGASWNFVLWGALHGAALVCHRGYVALRTRATPGWRPSAHPLARCIAWLAMSWFVLVSWIVFRVREPEAMLTALHRFVFFDGDLTLQGVGLGTLPVFGTLWLLAAFALLHVMSIRLGSIEQPLGRLPFWAAAAVCASTGVVAFALWPLSSAPFIYFQF